MKLVEKTSEKQRLDSLENIYPVELSAPDITAYAAGNTGVPYYTTLDSGIAGPHAAILALTHGNEICGAITLDTMFRCGLTPTRGKLTLGFNNVAAYAQFDARYPAASRFVDEDMNRVWATERLDGDDQSIELARAREIRPLIDTVDFLLDLHSMQSASPPLMLAGPLAKGHEFASRLQYPETIMCDAGHAAGKRLRDYGDFGDANSPRNALLVEAGQHWAASSGIVSTDSAVCFLQALDMIDAATAKSLSQDTRPAAQRTIEVIDRVTINSDHFQFHQPYTGLEVIPKAGTELGIDGDTPVVTPFDDCVLIMPTRRTWKGQTAVRLGRYVK